MSREPDAVGVIGVGWVGLVTAVCFAELGHRVVARDIVAAKVESLARGQATVHEPGLEEMLRRNLERITFTTEMATVLDRARLLFVCVDTPPTYSGDADLSRVRAVVEELPEDGEHALVMKSTVPAGTGEAIRRDLPGLAYVSCPEFLKEGSAVADFMHPDRVVIGADPGDEDAAAAVAALYAPLGGEILRTDVASAEMIKLASNAFLATKISFINEIANLCEKVGADINEVRRGIGHDRRIGHHFLFPGVGYGGSCFPKDVQAVISSAQDHQLDFTLLRAVEEVNDRQKRLLVGRVLDFYGGDVTGRRFAIWGLAFKPRTDDMREAPAVIIVDRLLAAGAEIAVHDPEAMTEAQKIFGSRVSYHRVNYDTLEGADALIIVTEWNEFRRPDFERMKKLLKAPVIFDGRNLYEPTQMEEHGFTYFSMGRRAVRPGQAAK